MENKKTIREQIYDKIEEYKKMFVKETGVECEMFPKLNIEKKELDIVGDIVLEHTGYNVYKNISREYPVQAAKVAFAMIADVMGYTDKEIANYIGVDRSSVPKYRSKHQTRMAIEPKYKKEFDKILALVYKNQQENINNE